MRIASISKLRRAIDRHGLGGALKVACGKLVSLVHNFRPSVRAESRERERRAAEFDAEFGVDTSGFIHPTELRISHPNQRHAISYRGSDPKYFHDAMSSLPIDYRRFVFIDFGSGKGRALLLATKFPFKRIVGVEFSPGLHQIAKENIDRFSQNADHAFEVESICMDATAFTLPVDPLVCYFFNPFDADIMQRVLSNIRNSLARAPRDLFVVYYNPREGNVFDNSDCFGAVGHIGPIRIWQAPMNKTFRK